MEVTIKEFDSGRAAFTKMLNEGGLDMVTVAQTPIMFNSFNRSDFAIVAAMVSSYNDVFVLARSDRGIAKPGDLRGKKIGLTKGSTGQYFLGLFLSNNNIQPSEVEEVDIPAGKLAESIPPALWMPFRFGNRIFTMQKRPPGDKSITFPPEKIFREDFYFVPSLRFLQNNPEAITRFLQAVKQAEDFIEENKDETVDIAARLV